MTDQDDGFLDDEQIEQLLQDAKRDILITAAESKAKRDADRAFLAEKGTPVNRWDAVQEDEDERQKTIRKLEKAEKNLRSYKRPGAPKDKYIADYFEEQATKDWLKKQK